MSGGFNRSDIVDFFLVEASEHLQLLNDGLLSLEENSSDLSVVDEIFRSAHTIKGSAAMLGFNVISKLAHKMEDLLGKIRNQETTLSESVIDLLLQSIDTLTAQVEGIPNGEEEDASILLMFDDLYAEFLGPAAEAQDVSASEPPFPEKDEGIPEELEPLKTAEILPELEADPLSEEVPPESFDDIFPALDDEFATSSEEPPTAPPPAAKPLSQRAEKTRTAAPKSIVSAGEKKIVRVDVEGLNLLMNLVGELVINRTRLDQRIAYVNQLSSELNFSQERLLRVIRGFKEKYEFGQLSERNSEIGLAFANQLANSLEQQEESGILEGFFDLEFDKYDDFNILSRRLVEIGSDISEIMNQLNDFFEQFEEESSLIRRITDNLQEEITNIRMIPVGQLFNRFHRTVRDAAKQESKQVSLHISGADARLDKTVVNEIADPLMHLIRNSVSHGIESPAKRKASGKPEEGNISLKAYKEGDNIIIEIADDGGGINVQRVRETIAEKGLRSMADVENMPDDEVIRYIFAPGFSTKKDVSAISGRGVGMDVVKTNIARLEGSIDIKTEWGKGTKFSIQLPLTLVIYAALLVKCGEQEFAISLTSVEETARIPINHIHQVASREVIKLRDQILPIRKLHQILQLSRNGQPDHQEELYMPIVIVRSADSRLALMVDELIGRETIVIKPLGDYLKKLPIFSGATISGEGQVRLILDIPAVIEQELAAHTSGEVTSAKIALDEEFEAPLVQAPQKPDILLVDDSISIRKMVGMMLNNAGYNVDTASDGVEAIEKISNKVYNLIVTDLEMPRMHGYELMAEIRQGYNIKDIPIIVLTSRSGEKHSQKAHDLGANDYIIKPVDEETLLKSVQQLLRS